jgi:hypothetical protein
VGAGQLIYSLLRLFADEPLNDLLAEEPADREADHGGDIRRQDRQQTAEQRAEEKAVGDRHQQRRNRDRRDGLQNHQAGHDERSPGSRIPRPALEAAEISRAEQLESPADSLSEGGIEKKQRAKPSEGKEARGLENSHLHGW